MRKLVSVGTCMITLATTPLAAADNERPPPAKITREAATATALKLVPGWRGKVEIERKNGRWVYVVEVISAQGQETDVFVDMETGAVIGTD